MSTISPRRALLWRVHGLAAMLATPFLLVAAITGLVYVPAPQIDAWQLALLERSSDASQAVRPLDVALVMSAAIVLTGLTWSRYAGTQIRTLRDAAGQAPPRAPASLKSQPVVTDAARLSWQAVWDTACRRAPDVAMHIGISPQHGTWRVASADTRWPTRRFETHLDAHSGAVLFHAGWKEQTAFAKAIAIGIPPHRGEVGWWNEALLVVFGITVLFSTVTGWAMW